MVTEKIASEANDLPYRFSLLGLLNISKGVDEQDF